MAWLPREHMIHLQGDCWLIGSLPEPKEGVIGMAKTETLRRDVSSVFEVLGARFKAIYITRARLDGNAVSVVGSPYCVTNMAEYDSWAWFITGAHDEDGYR